MPESSQTVRDLAASIAADAPSPSSQELPAFIGPGGDADTGGLNEPANTEGVEVDSSGAPWDSSKHAASKTRKADGTWRLKNGRKPGSTLNLPGAPPPPPAPLPHLSDAQALVTLITGMHAGAFGREWLTTPEEAPVLVEGTRAYLESIGGFAMPPWAVLIGVYAQYAGARFQLPSTQKRVSAIAEKASVFWKGIRARFARKVAKPAPQPQKAAAEQPAHNANLPPGAEVGFDPNKRKVN